MSFIEDTLTSESGEEVDARTGRAYNMLNRSLQLRSVDVDI